METQTSFPFALLALLLLFCIGQMAVCECAASRNIRPELHEVRDQIVSGSLSRNDMSLFRPLFDSLLDRDEYRLLADYRFYIDCRNHVGHAFLDRQRWNRLSVMLSSEILLDPRNPRTLQPTSGKRRPLKCSHFPHYRPSFSIFRSCP